MFAWLAGHQRAFLDIGAGTEYGSAAREHDGAYILAIVQRIEDADHFLADRAPQCVDGRPVQGHRRHQVGDVKFRFSSSMVNILDWLSPARRSVLRT
jgi:hypothetical protein